nr:TIGR04283 family arsenosugar biosynthesis glycosyltransferase [Synechococcus sp. UW140]
MHAGLPSLSVVIPCLNEAERLPLLLADLQCWRGSLQIMVVDGGSRDHSSWIARMAGAECVHAPRPGRGAQLQCGAAQALAPWLLFLHADSRLNPAWAERVMAVMEDPKAIDAAWYFDLRIEPGRPALRMLEALVALRSRWLQRPYGDQGLLLHRRLYQRCGGYAPLPLMEDLDLVERLAPRARLRPLGQPLVSDGRRWSGSSVLQRSWGNARLRQRWYNGESAEQLAATYYDRHANH